MSITPAVPEVQPVRRVRHQARDVVVVMAFSAGMSTALTVALFTLASLGR